MSKKVHDTAQECKTHKTKMYEFNLNDEEANGLARLEQLTGIQPHFLIHLAVQNYIKTHEDKINEVLFNLPPTPGREEALSILYGPEHECKTCSTKMHEVRLNADNAKGITQLEQLTGIPEHVLINLAVKDYASTHKISGAKS